MMTTIQPAFCGLLPHPPIIVPEVGRERLDDRRQAAAGPSTLAEDAECVPGNPVPPGGLGRRRPPPPVFR